MGNTQLLEAGHYYCPKEAAPFLWTPKLRTCQYKARFGLFFNKNPPTKTQHGAENTALEHASAGQH